MINFLQILFQALLLLSCLSVVLADFAAEDLRRFQKASSNRPLRTLRPLRKQRPSAPGPDAGIQARRGLDQEEFRGRPVTFHTSFFQSNRIGMRQTPGPVGYLAHVLRLLSYLVSLKAERS